MAIDREALISGCGLGLLVGVVAAAMVAVPVSMVSTRGAPPAITTEVPVAAGATRPAPIGAAFGALAPSPDLRWLVERIAERRDNGNAGFIVVDKRAAQLHVFDADAQRVASTAVLLGAARGDASVPGIGTRPMTSIRKDERTTPAGRFVGEQGRNTSGEDVVWVDYDAAVSMHRVRLKRPSERRAERLASPTAADNRISYGCINVPVAFYEQYIQTLFASRRAVIYVLPDIRTVHEVFGPEMYASR